MFVKTLLLIAFGFAVIYPLNFWLPFSDSFKNRFRKFNIGASNTAGGVVLISVCLLNIPLYFKVFVTLWKILLFSISRYYWRKGQPDPRLMTLPCLLGAYVLFLLQRHFGEPGWGSIFIGAFSGIGVCALFFFYKIQKDK